MAHAQAGTTIPLASIHSARTHHADDYDDDDYAAAAAAGGGGGGDCSASMHSSLILGRHSD